MWKRWLMGCGNWETKGWGKMWILFSYTKCYSCLGPSVSTPPRFLYCAGFQVSLTTSEKKDCRRSSCTSPKADLMFLSSFMACTHLQSTHWFKLFLNASHFGNPPCRLSHCSPTSVSQLHCLKTGSLLGLTPFSRLVDRLSVDQESFSWAAAKK